MNLWQSALAANPMIAILRGLEPAQAISVADVLVDCGFRFIEVPLNSPEPIRSIEKIADKHGDQVVVGAGTVLTENDVRDVVTAGGRIIVAPNMDLAVGARSVSLGARWCPGVATPTEAFEALRHGASVLKFFPAEMISPQVISALRAVLPSEAVLAAVGGITPETMRSYHAAGAVSFGLGSALFKPAYTLEDIKRRATGFVQAYAQLKGKASQ